MSEPEQDINRLRLLGRGTPRPAPHEVADPTDPLDFKTDKSKHDLANSDTVQRVVIPKLRERIEFLDDEESQHLGTPRQHELRGRRMEAKRALSEWLTWSGQADEAPDEGV